MPQGPPRPRRVANTRSELLDQLNTASVDAGGRSVPSRSRLLGGCQVAAVEGINHRRAGVNYVRGASDSQAWSVKRRSWSSSSWANGHAVALVVSGRRAPVRHEPAQARAAERLSRRQRTAGQIQPTCRLSHRRGSEKGVLDPGSSINGSIPTANWSACKSTRKVRRRFTARYQSPLTDSNRRPPPYHQGSAATGGKPRQRFPPVSAVSPSSHLPAVATARLHRRFTHCRRLREVVAPVC